MRYLREEDRELASRFLFLSMALVVISKDIYTIEQGPYKIKEPYLELLHKMEHKGKIERKNLKQIMQQKKVNVLLLNKNESFTSYLFTANRYEEKRNYFNPAIRKKVEIIMHELMQKALQSEHGKLNTNGGQKREAIN
ncbi:hypothetical protein [Pontibacillus litoralis]|uniref:Uncharacterized protein n=1 Tax=Pontibacillus litoralis JSM 072002 TaxID=1385512 RepID=A0A0A5G149_9BACI|nr:hypothetical protein [Pontibacillus litoralis]KGX84800.1 hypothetical protein N784_11965 [Pontibacillus litoralis JSM 072002]